MELPPGSGEFLRVHTVGMAAGFYYSKESAANGDMELSLATFIVQHISFRPVVFSLYSLLDDIHLLSATLDKLELLREVSTDSLRFSFLVESELEHLFVLLRSMYDLLQRMMKHIGELMRTKDGGSAFKKLPDSFAAIALKKGQLRTTEELQKDFKLPPLLAGFYQSESSLFLKIRTIRNSLAHSGRRLPSVFVTEHGFGVSTEGSEAWSSLEVWKQHELLPNKIGSVRALAAFLVGSFLKTLNNFASALQGTIHPTMLPVAVSEGNRIFIRDPAVGRLSNLNQFFESPWVTKTTSNKQGDLT